MMVTVIGIKFENNERIYYFSPVEKNLRENDYVIVETERGLQYGVAVTNIEDISEDKVYLPLKPVIRKATKEDQKQNHQNIIDAQKALNVAKKIVEKSNLDMKLFEASYTFDRKKLIFKFIADERVDFRELAKILAAKYKTRIELRQIGVRDKAKEIGGLGPCGRPICCNTFLNTFDSVSINTAKNQGIALNPSKINGSCGRLLCCLGYEDDIYTENRKTLPKLGQTIDDFGVKGKVIELNILKKTYKILTEENEEIEFLVNEDGSNKRSS